METYTPNQIAGTLQVSTTTLRRYEEQELIPPVPRTPSNHRFYGQVHVQAFRTIRALLLGYDIPVVYEAMRMFKQGRPEQALWLVNEQQYQIQAEKQRVEEILTMIRGTDFTRYKNIKLKEQMNIGEVATIAGVNTSAIRHWESEGLIQSQRNKENGFRMFSIAELRKILVISSLRKTVYYIDNMKSLLNDLDTQDNEQIERSFQLALKNLNERLRLQFKGIAEMMGYLEVYAGEGQDL
ncbi:MerR family transcriptional regulator [Paenibacillus sp. FSL R7-0273]|uniref:MerR family transcriptional regulator n=1 Tax=Paenibacillus sp. FSL R7-0273 TaxID=1536772 RepID=UPI0004F7E202|nr:MerR family transcriptional regulator [Paenibacillus sp. FSL R7-0273]AIQ47946.1 MerR family transcriptional regulator [Paenibacillus sp. FSL R7-0273]OMF94503.1 MerR family transcriptional regulator [Paenibacillus sp. FSL R7-0273]